MTDQPTNEEPTPAAPAAAPQSEAPASRTIVALGNRAAVEVIRGQDDAGNPTENRRTITGAPRKNKTEIRIRPDANLLEAVTEVVALWKYHSDDTSPAWVASTNPQLAQMLAAQWSCEIRDYEPDHDASGAGDLVPAKEA